MVSGGSSEVGVSKITTEVLQVVERLPKMVEGITGVDIAKVLPCGLFRFLVFVTPAVPRISGMVLLQSGLSLTGSLCVRRKIRNVATAKKARVSGHGDIWKISSKQRLV